MGSSRRLLMAAACFGALLLAGAAEPALQVAIELEIEANGCTLLALPKLTGPPLRVAARLPGAPGVMASGGVACSRSQFM